MTIKYTFSGHDSFQCKDLWLKKGYDFVIENKIFSDSSSVVDLGVGRNMVSSIRYWLKSFGITDEEGLPTEFGNLILSDDGYDPYIENFGTLWLLHYKIVTLRIATIYNLFFAEFHKEYKEFNQEQLMKFIKRKCSEVQFPYNENTLKTDIGVLFKSYLKPENGEKSIDEFSSLLIDLDLLELSSSQYENRTFKFKYQDSKKIDAEIALFILLDYFEGQKVIDFLDLANLFSIFCIYPEELIDILTSIMELYAAIVYSNDAGIKQVQIISNLDKWQVLSNYFNKTNFISR